jgi:hypothetical protein
MVGLVTAVMSVRADVVLTMGDIGTLGRQIGLGSVILAFGIGLYRWWNEELGERDQGVSSRSCAPIRPSPGIFNSFTSTG